LFVSELIGGKNVRNIFLLSDLTEQSSERKKKIFRTLIESEIYYETIA